MKTTFLKGRRWAIGDGRSEELRKAGKKMNIEK
jgi:hypothetical protein